MNNLPRLISLSGAAGSGKDEVASIIQHLSTESYVIKRFAGKLKIITGVLLGVSQTKLEDRAFKESILGPEWDYEVWCGDCIESEMRSMTVREFLQKLGTDCLREGLHKDIWVNSLFREFDDSSRWIIPDLRFKNEFEAVKQRGGIHIRVDRPELAEDLHPSETEWKNLPFDWVINNDKDLPHLRTLVQGMLNTYK